MENMKSGIDVTPIYFKAKLRVSMKPTAFNADERPYSNDMRQNYLYKLKWFINGIMNLHPAKQLSIIYIHVWVLPSIGRDTYNNNSENINMIDLREDSSAKHRAVIKLITPPIMNEITTDGPAIMINCPIKRKKLDPILAPNP
jgi:hypothetical protein